MENPPPFHGYPRPPKELEKKNVTVLIVVITSFVLLFCGLPIGCMIVYGPD